jgi:hypothetical protein
MCVGMRRVYLLGDPLFDDAQDVRGFVLAERTPLPDLVNLRQTSAATRSRRMLGHEDRMIPPRRLLSIVPRKRRRQSLADELCAMLHDGRQSPRLDIRALAANEPELSPERRRCEAAEGFVDVDHGVRERDRERKAFTRRRGGAENCFAPRLRGSA